MEDDELIVKVGISDGWKYNQQYKILLTSVGLRVTTNHCILLEFERSCLPLNTSATCSTQSWYSYFYITQQLDSSIKLEIVEASKSWSRKKVCSVYEISSTLWRHLIHEENSIPNRREKLEGSRKLQYKIQSEHVEQAIEFMKLNYCKKISIERLRYYLDEECKWQELSMSGARYLLRNVLKYTYKRAHVVPK